MVARIVLWVTIGDLHIATLTNGVSFELVAGALCYIKFLHSPLGSYANPLSLNINSSGAKYFEDIVITFKNGNEIVSTYRTNTKYNASDGGTKGMYYWYQSKVENSNFSVVIYTGEYYTVVDSGVKLFPYADYPET